MNQRNPILGGAIVICWTIWKTRNNACVYHRYPNDSASPCSHFAAILTLGQSYRRDEDQMAILQKVRGQKNLEYRVMLIKMVIQEVFSPRHGWEPMARKI